MTNYKDLPIWNPENLVLEADQWLLKVKDGVQTLGFATKLTQKNVLPKAFDEWENPFWRLDKYPTLPIFVLDETFRSGWEFVYTRVGKSQNWVALKHPLGFILEIYMKDFNNILCTETLIAGVIQGEFKWQDNKLIKKV